MATQFAIFFLFAASRVIVNNLRHSFILFSMVYSEDVKRIFRERGEELVGCEVSLLGNTALVISGHRGLCSLSPEEIVVRRKRYTLRVTGSDLRLEKASPAELYVSGVIRAIECVDPRHEVEC